MIDNPTLEEPFVGRPLTPDMKEIISLMIPAGALPEGVLFSSRPFPGEMYITFTLNGRRETATWRAHRVEESRHSPDQNAPTPKNR